jgi:hypothetical protein
MGPELLKQLLLLIGPEALKAGWKFIKSKWRRKRKNKLKNLYR